MKNKINIIIAICSILIGVAIFILIYINYNQQLDFYNNANEIEGYVYNVHKIKNNYYNFEYKYVVDSIEYKVYIPKMKFRTLSNNDSIKVYYDINNHQNNILSKPSKNNIYIAITFLALFTFIGMWIIIKTIKK